MLFRIEDSQNSDGNHRKYTLSKEQLPLIRLGELNLYIADEVRKEINNTKDRKLLSFSKSLGVCLLKYNKFADNELHIVADNNVNYVCYYDMKKSDYRSYYLDVHNGVFKDLGKHPKREILLHNFVLDVSDNFHLDHYLRTYTNIGKKQLASPEKDKEVVMMQVYNDMYISEYTSSIYLLYALVLRYGMDSATFFALFEKIMQLDDYRFEFCNNTEHQAILMVVQYLYYNQQYEQGISDWLLEKLRKDDMVSFYYDPITQLQDIQDESFEDSYMLGDYNSNIISEWIWEIYKKKIYNF